MIDYQYCPYCGTKSTRGQDHLDCPDCKRKVYFSSTPSAGVFIVKDDTVLLVKRGIKPRKGMYDFPGGFLKVGEKPEDGIRREIFEELGVKIKILEILGIYINEGYVYQNEKIYPQDTVFLAEIVSGKPVPKDDVQALEWFPIEAPPKKVSFKSVANALRDLKKWHETKSKL